jgi:hypothetical protein
MVCRAFLYEPRGRLTAQNGGFRSGQVRQIRLDMPNNYYVYEVDWYDADSLLVRTMNRQQTAADLCICSVHTGSCTVLLTETDPEGAWVCDTSCRMTPVPGCLTHIPQTLVCPSRKSSKFPDRSSTPRQSWAPSCTRWCPATAAASP